MRNPADTNNFDSEPDRENFRQDRPNDRNLLLDVGARLRQKKEDALKVQLAITSLARLLGRMTAQDLATKPANYADSSRK